MMFRTLFSVAFLSLASLGNLLAQPPTFPVWRAEMPGGEYAVKLSAIASVSKHDYTVDGTLGVQELTIATNTNVTARFYFIEPKTPSAASGVGDSAIRTIKDRASQALEKVNQTAHTTIMTEVVKNYPVTTHAHMVEFRLPTADALKAAYESARNAWLRNKTATFKMEDDE